MRSLIDRFKGLTGLLLLAFFMVSWGMIDANAGFTTGRGGGGFTGRALITVDISADRPTLPANIVNAAPNPGGFYTNTFNVVVKRDGRLFPAPNVAVDIVSGLPSGALFYLDGDAAHEDEDGNPLAFRRLTFENTTGIVTAHFHSSSTPGTVVLVATATDPQTGQVVNANLTITVGPGVSTGQPAVVSLLRDGSPLYITGQGYQDVKRFQVAVLDDANQPVPNPTGNNVRLRLLPNRPNGGERLVALMASGAVQQGPEVNTQTVNGIAEVALHSGFLPGTAQIEVIADRADNNVDNGIQSAVIDVQTIPMSSGVIASLTFTGPYPGAVAQRRNSLPLGDGDSIDFATGVYSRAISVIAADEFGNPPPVSQFITFRLMDGPLTGYPDQGRGTFDIAGNDGNPEEGGNTFSTPDPEGSSLLGARVNCQLVLEGGAGQVGGWIVSGVAPPHWLSVNTPFTFNPPGFDTGFTVPYTIGCPPYVGNVANIIDGVTVTTDVNGLASTIMNYPITQLGRNFIMTVEADGGRVGGVMRGWYLGIPDGSTLTVVPESDLNLQVPVGEEITKSFTLQLFDGGDPPAPLPAERLEVRVAVTDPDHDAFLAAEGKVAGAQAALNAALASNPAGCSIVPPQPDPTNPEDPRCAPWRSAVLAAQNALTAARAELAVAQARDELFAPTVAITPDPPLITGVNGIATMTVTVSDLYTAAVTGGTGDAKVQLFISTIGPEIRAETITITISPAVPE